MQKYTLNPSITTVRDHRAAKYAEYNYKQYYNTYKYYSKLKNNSKPEPRKLNHNYRKDIARIKGYTTNNELYRCKEYDSLKRELSLSNHPLCDFINRKNNNGYNSVRKIMICFYSYKKIPKFIKECKNITELTITVTNIKTIPKWITKLQNLTHLILYNNVNIEYLPGQFNSPKITWDVLDIGENKLKYINLYKSKIKKIILGNITTPLFPNLPENSTIKIYITGICWPNEYNWLKHYINRGIKFILYKYSGSIPEYIRNTIRFEKDGYF